MMSSSDIDDGNSSYKNKIWAQCESPSCLKWRLVPRVDEVSLKLDLEKPWYCWMNPDPLLRHCSLPQDHPPDDTLFKEQMVKVVYPLLPSGSLVLVKACKWPWWPAILSLDPDEGEYVRLDSKGHVEKYHVEFLGKPHTRFWASAKSVKIYHSISTKLKNLKGTLRRSYDVAIDEAMKICEMKCEDRLQICHFKAQDVLCEAQMLMNAIEKMIRQCTSAGCSNQQLNQSKVKQCFCEGSIEEVGDMLIIEGFRFESATSREDIGKQL